MAVLLPANHALMPGTENVDARDKPGHDDLVQISNAIALPLAGAVKKERRV
jgi:hypothetical protein